MVENHPNVASNSGWQIWINDVTLSLISEDKSIIHANNSINDGRLEILSIKREFQHMLPEKIVKGDIRKEPV